jgi:3-demethoxyubiquinol 3-hydroxylase
MIMSSFRRMSSSSKYDWPSRESVGDERAHAVLDEIVRVNQAGEYGAKWIYEGQLAALKSRSDVDSRTVATVQHMADQEQEHLQHFDELVRRYRVRPSALSPLWKCAGYGAGFASAALGGKQGAMALTVAVETVIGRHYNDQLRQLHESGVGDEQLRATIRKFRDDELEHLDVAKQHEAEQAPLYNAFSRLIQAGTSIAVEVAKRI